jgi:hypothetical protein
MCKFTWGVLWSVVPSTTHNLIVLTSHLLVYRWTAAGTFKATIARPKNVWGLILLVAMNVLWIFSTNGWRKGKGLGYRVFIWSHVLGVIVTIPAVSGSHKLSISNILME